VINNRKSTIRNQQSTINAISIQSALDMITVYGADWCEDTQRSLRHLRRLGVPHEYLNIDEDLDALHRAKSLNHGLRRTPVIDLGLGGPALVEPDNDSLTGALVEREMLAQDDVVQRLAIQNVGDFERVLRTLAGAALLLVSRALPRPMKAPFVLTGAVATFSGLTGWCPAYHVAGVTSLDGPGDRPDEGRRATWLAPRRISPTANASGTGSRATP
jgi:glutaredoxin-related protein